MELQEFVEKFAEQFEETNASEFNPDTEFKALDEWSSLYALSIVAMISEEYDIVVKGDDIRNSETIQDLYEFVKGKIK